MTSDPSPVTGHELPVSNLARSNPLDRGCDAAGAGRLLLCVRNPLEVVAALAGGEFLPRSLAIIRQRALVFEPFVLPAMCGTPVVFPKSDRVAHHLKSFSMTASFEFPVYEPGARPRLPLMQRLRFEGETNGAMSFDQKPRQRPVARTASAAGVR